MTAQALATASPGRYHVREDERARGVERLLARMRVGIVLSEHTDEDGAAIFQQACRIGWRASCRSA
jgi:hypothetical protein